MSRLPKKSLFLVMIVALAIAAVYQLMRPLPTLEATKQIPIVPKTSAISLPWPAAGQSAIGAAGYGVLETHNVASPVPVASIAKVITAMAVLQQKPLAAGNQGPTITLDNTDLGYFNYYSQNDGSVAKVSDGEQISEYQALQTMLIPSANNMADSLARWAFGSTATYITYANQMVSKLGLTHTTVGNTNGFDDTTTSTADDLVKLALQALQNPVIADVVSQSTANVPEQGQVKNVNWLLGSSGVIGIKTGNTDKAGGCYLFAAKHQIAGKQIVLVGANLGTPDLTSAISSGRDLLVAADSGFQQITALNQSQVLGSYTTPWGASAQFKPAKDLPLVIWKGQAIKISNNPRPVKTPQAAGASVGSVSVESGGQSVKANLTLSQSLPTPTFWWRIFR
jgi:serine-type D-Ala-D-Ala carboxypeptidase (penicillin-binding protein 5/6)